MKLDSSFPYLEAFSGNLAWLDKEDQKKLRCCRVAISNVGGLGGGHLLALARLGVGAFHIADSGTFDMADLNYHPGAVIETLNSRTAEVMRDMVKRVNPDADIQVFGEEISMGNVDSFLSGVDVYVEGFDIFSIVLREFLYKACDRLGIPAVMAMPVGVGAVSFNFLPGAMGFSRYFDIDGRGFNDRHIRFLVGALPAAYLPRYLKHLFWKESTTSVEAPTSVAAHLCSSMAATETLKIMLRRGRVICAPGRFHIDLCANRSRHFWMPGGNRNPVQMLRIARARKRFLRGVD